MKNVRSWSELPKAQIIKTIQKHMQDSKGTAFYLETLNKDELKTLLLNLI
jgi:hypothetical protein